MSTDNEQQDREFALWARLWLDAAARGLDNETRARLRAARLRALEQARHTAGHVPEGNWLAAGGLAAAVVALVVAVTLLWVGTAHNGMLPSLDDLELLAGRDSPEFFADLEFYRWLAEHDHAG